MPGLGRRWFSLAETPDLDVIPHALPGATRRFSALASNCRRCIWACGQPAGGSAGCRCPGVLAPVSWVREWVDADGRLGFDIELQLQLQLHLGRVVRYRGWLLPDGEAAPGGADPHLCPAPQYISQRIGSTQSEPAIR